MVQTESTTEGPLPPENPSVGFKHQLDAVLLFIATGCTLVSQSVAQSSRAPEKAADASAAIPTFEVASIKPNKAGNGMMRIMFTPDGVSYTGISVLTLLKQTFDVEDDRLLGAPGWAASDRFDIEAKVDAADAPRLKDLKFEQRRAMLLPLLTDRFNLKFHHETRELPLYALVIAKGGSKLKEVKPEDPAHPQPRGWMSISRGKLDGREVTIEPLLHLLAQQLGRTVQDKTGLTGNYTYVLQWTPDDAPPPMAKGGNGSPPGGDATPTDSTGPSLFTALQEQLGLKLESTKGPVDVVVIDHIEAPSAN
jgi:uncharacterized protein (TIGR03435 family)